MSKIILHIDLNAFFVRCEEIRNPSLIGKPVLIGHLGRAGIVSTCSYKAREFGIRSGMPMFKATALCKDAIIIPGDYNYYSKKSHEFFSFVLRYSKIVEKASIDECYVDMTNELEEVKDVISYLKEFQTRLTEETGLWCSIGVAPTKFLAKMASDMKKPLGITIIRRKDIPTKIYPLPIEDFYGIGKKTAPKLKEMGINTIKDLAAKLNNNDESIKSFLGKSWSILKDWVNGYGSDEVIIEPEDPKSIGMSTTLMHDSNNYEELKETLNELSKDVCEKAKIANKIGGSVQLVMKDNDFKVINRSKTLSKPTNEHAQVFNAILDLLDKNFEESKSIRLVGVTLQKLIDPSDAHIQISLFDNYEQIKEECATTLLIGELNRKMNKTVFKTAKESLKEKNNGSR